MDTCMLHPCERQAVECILEDIRRRAKGWDSCSEEDKRLLALKLAMLSPPAFKYLVSRIKQTCATRVVEWAIQIRQMMNPT